MNDYEAEYLWTNILWLYTAAVLLLPARTSPLTGLSTINYVDRGLNIRCICSPRMWEACISALVIAKSPASLSLTMPGELRQLIEALHLLLVTCRAKWHFPTITPKASDTNQGHVSDYLQPTALSGLTIKEPRSKNNLADVSIVADEGSILPGCVATLVALLVTVAPSCLGYRAIEAQDRRGMRTGSLRDMQGWRNHHFRKRHSA